MKTKRNIDVTRQDVEAMLFCVEKELNISEERFMFLSVFSAGLRELEEKIEDLSRVREKLKFLLGNDDVSE